MKKIDLALISGTGTEAIHGTVEQIRVGTPYGLAPPIFIGEIGQKTVAFLPRHGVNHSVPPHKINYRANIYALHSLGATRVIATSAAGAINPRFKPGDLVIPDDLIDFTRLRANTFYDDAPVTHIDVCEPYCPELRFGLIKAAERKRLKAFAKAVFVCNEGPRFETPAEIRMLERLGGDLVGMTGMPETVLARELGMCYATVCIVTNMAAGLDKHLPTNDLAQVAKKTAPALQQVLRETALHLPEKPQCQCSHALGKARYKG